MGLTTANQEKTILVRAKYIYSNPQRVYVPMVVLFMIIRTVDSPDFISLAFMNK